MSLPSIGRSSCKFFVRDEKKEKMLDRAILISNDINRGMVIRLYIKSDARV